MPLRDLILNNLRWKLSALILAVFVWFSIKPSGRHVADSRTFSFLKQPVLALSSPGDGGVYQIRPAAVDVTIRAAANALNRLTEAGIKVFVKTFDMTNAVSKTKQIFVHTPEGVEVFDIQVEPPAVTVVRLDLSK